MKHAEMVKKIEKYLENRRHKVVVAPHARKKKDSYQSDDKEIGLYNCTGGKETKLSNADILLYKEDTLPYLFEIEAGNPPSPKHIIGTIEATNQSNKCYVGKVKGEHIYQIRGCYLFIVLDDSSVYGKAKKEQIKWINNNYPFKGNYLRGAKVCYLNDFEKEFKNCGKEKA